MDAKNKLGPRIASYGETIIYEGFPYYIYEVVDQLAGEKEKALANELKNLILGSIGVDDVKKALPLLDKQFFIEIREKIISQIAYKNALSVIIEPDEFNALKINLITLLRQFIPDVKDPAILSNTVLDQTIGYGVIAPLMRDAELEEIMLNGRKKPVFVVHKKYGMCRTNITLDRERITEALINKIAGTVGKHISANNPLLDARLLEGNRANATFANVTPMGPTLTIRKFAANPLSIIDLIANGTVSSEMAAFLWTMVEGMNVEPMNIIVTGGAGSGKTTILNALVSFVRYQDRIITIEDTLELHLGERENWIQMEAQVKTKESDEITMDELLKNSLRMRPDRIILGEVRGSEAQTLFVAMDTGHSGCMGTLHSNSGKEVIMRLKAEPMAVAESMIPLLNLVVVMYRIYSREKGVIRRAVQVSEITSMEGKPLISEIFEWNRTTDAISRTNIPSHTMETLSEKTMKSKKEIMREISIRKKILEWMQKNGIRNSSEVENLIQGYYINPNELIQEVFGSEGNP